MISQVFFESFWVSKLIGEVSVNLDQAPLDLFHLVHRYFLGVEHYVFICEHILHGLVAHDGLFSISDRMLRAGQTTLIGFVVEVESLEVVGHLLVVDLTGGVVLELHDVVHEHVLVLLHRLSNLGSPVDDFQKVLRSNVHRSLRVDGLTVTGDLHEVSLETHPVQVALSELLKVLLT